MALSVDTLTKQPAETRLLAMEFAVGRTETLASVVSATSVRLAGTGNITISAPAVVGNEVRLSISGGAAGDLHKVTVVVSTGMGQTLEGEGQLFVRDF